MPRIVEESSLKIELRMELFPLTVYYRVQAALIHGLDRPWFMLDYINDLYLDIIATPCFQI